MGLPKCEVGLAGAQAGSAESVGDTVGADWLITLMAGVRATGAFFLDVGHLAIRPDVAIPA